MKTLRLIGISIAVTIGLISISIGFVKFIDYLVYIGKTYGMIYPTILGIIILFILVFTIVKKTIL